MNGIKADPDIKMDPDAITPSGSGYMDDDFYEDTGELQLPPKGDEKDVWLTRIPKWLYDAVSKWEDLADGSDHEQVVIGEVLAIPDQMRQGGLSKTEPMRVFLNHRTLAEKQLPQAFELKMTPATNEVLGSTYIFTEKDLPGYKPNGLGQAKMAATGSFGVQDPKARVQKRNKYKKAIPSMLSSLTHINGTSWSLTNLQNRQLFWAVQPVNMLRIPFPQRTSSSSTRSAREKPSKVPKKELTSSTLSGIIPTT